MEKLPTEGKYLLVNKKVIPCIDLMEWARWMEDNQEACRIALDEIGTTRISTVFLGLDFACITGGRRRIFETMTFEDGEPGDQWRYATYDEAIAGHNAAVDRVRKEVNNPKTANGI